MKPSLRDSFKKWVFNFVDHNNWTYSKCRFSGAVTMSVVRLLRRKIWGKTKSYILNTERNKMPNLSENEKNLKFSSFMYKSNKIAQSQLNLAPLHNG